MRRTRSTPSARICVVKSLLATALACLIVAASVPAGAVSAAHGCRMPCCEGKGVGGMAGDCEGGSCPIRNFAPAPPPEPVASEPMCGATPAPSSHGGEAQALNARSGHAAPRDYIRHGIEHDAHREIEHDARSDVSPHHTSSHARFVSASVSRPCPPDCGALLNSFTQSRRTRDGAALAHGLRPRPPTVATLPRAFTRASKTSSELRRQCSPRAPPSLSPAD